MARFWGWRWLDPQTVGAEAVGSCWGLMTLGCLLGLLILELLDSRKVLSGASVITIVTLLLALFRSVGVVRVAFPALGFTIAMMWSIIFLLATNSVPKQHGSFSGSRAPASSAARSARWSSASSAISSALWQEMLFLLLPFGYILSADVWARPLVNNATTFHAENKAAAAG